MIDESLGLFRLIRDVVGTFVAMSGNVCMGMSNKSGAPICPQMQFNPCGKDPPNRTLYRGFRVRLEEGRADKEGDHGIRNVCALVEPPKHHPIATLGAMGDYWEVPVNPKNLKPSTPKSQNPHVRAFNSGAARCTLASELFVKLNIWVEMFHPQLFFGRGL